ncbi:ABC transporter permease [Microbacterium sp.]|uniref:ABC transporter permease n=1 Tax=Microbacterium sp. TaxID=51671 RepID=UPI00281235FF|nr:ABC transporter permease [Microbacterium sp.]
MTTIQARATHQPTARFTLSFPRQLRSEWIKLASLRSTWWSISIVAVLTVGIALLMALAIGDTGMPGIQMIVSPIQFTMLLAGILGAISVTGEYSTGMIRSTLAATPIRGLVLAAKAAVLALFMFVTSLVIFGVAATVVSPILESKNAAIDWADFSGAIQPILIASLCMAVFALIGVAFGFLLRSGAGAIAATVGLLFVLPIVLSMFGMAGPAWDWIRALGDYLPASAAQNAIVPQDEWGLDEPVAFLTLAGWVAAGMLGAWAVLRGRDA